jgi:hypothetical protein
MKRERDSADIEEGDGQAVKGDSPAKRHKGASGAAAPPLPAAAPSGQQQQQQQQQAVAGDGDAELDDDARIVLPTSTTRSAVKKGRECPYLDTISRQVRRGVHARPQAAAGRSAASRWP